MAVGTTLAESRLVLTSRAFWVAPERRNPGPDLGCFLLSCLPVLGAVVLEESHVSACWALSLAQQLMEKSTALLRAWPVPASVCLLHGFCVCPGFE